MAVNDSPVSTRTEEMPPPAFEFMVTIIMGPVKRFEFDTVFPDEPGPAFQIADPELREALGLLRIELADNFKRAFRGKVEEAREETILQLNRTLETWDRRPLIEILGGEAKAEVMLSDVLLLLCEQPNGQAGPLKTPVGVNIFCIRDRFGKLVEVQVMWCGDRWLLTVEGQTTWKPSCWYPGHHLFLHG